MRQSLPTDRECSPEAAAYSFRPADPAWVGGETIARVRRELRAYDWRVTIWWDPFKSFTDEEHRGRWLVKEWYVGENRWATAFVIESEFGGYREPSTSAIIRDLQNSNRKRSEVTREVDEHNEKLEQSRKAQLRRSLADHINDGRARRHGSRMTFGPDLAPRSRDTILYGDREHLAETLRLQRELNQKTTPRLKKQDVNHG